MICAGKVLSQPPITTTASIGCARIISSVSIAIRLRRYIEVGCAKLSRNRNRREHHRHRAGQHHAALHRLDDLRHVAMARVVVAVGVGDADDRTVERVVGIAHRLDEGLAQKQRETRIAVTRQTLAQSVSHLLSYDEFGSSATRSVCYLPRREGALLSCGGIERNDFKPPLRRCFAICSRSGYCRGELHAAERAALVEIADRIGLQFCLFGHGMVEKSSARPVGR